MATTDEHTTTEPQTRYADASIKRTAESAIEYAYRDLGAGDVPIVRRARNAEFARSRAWGAPLAPLRSSLSLVGRSRRPAPFA